MSTISLLPVGTRTFSPKWSAKPTFQLSKLVNKAGAQGSGKFGLDHGVGHSLLLLDDVKAPNGQKGNEFKDLAIILNSRKWPTP